MTTVGVAWSQARAKKRDRPHQSVLLGVVTWAARTLPRWKKFRSTVVQLAGYGAINYGIFQMSVVAGWIALGVSLFVMDFATGDKK